MRSRILLSTAVIVGFGAMLAGPATASAPMIAKANAKAVDVKWLKNYPGGKEQK